MDEALLKQQAEVYKVAGVDDTEENKPAAKKRKRAEAKAPIKEKAQRENTAIYVTLLPDNVTEAALADFFGRCGLIAESVDSNKPRIKLYYNDDGSFKGDALIVFFRPESVKLAVDLYDDSPFPTTRGDNTTHMRIHPADESYKRHKDDLPQESKPAPAAKGQRGGASNYDREKAKRKKEEMNDRLMDWGEGDPSAVYGDRDRWEDRLVIIKEVFTQASIKQSIADGEDDYLEDIHEDMKEEAEKFGEVLDIVVYDLEDPGVVTVNFRSAEAAEECIKVFDGRNYDGRKLKAYTSDGQEVFHKTKGKSAAAPGQAGPTAPNK